MYLYRREYVSGHSFNQESELGTFRTITDALGIEATPDAPHVNIEICVAYWRKANAIHKWFCDLDDGRDECQSIYVSYDQLRELRDLCVSVLKQPAMAASALPTQPGFFFGSYEYDTWYMEDIKRTVDQLSKVLDSVGPDVWIDFVYKASW